ncbi:unnamed protein product [Chilo suppressalis]|uniref:Uncharacterized protein n=1 Tax=Chilo suppressalis TaxID=168631 RepID=A0ABN8EGI0_CHISP|nr:unnamed protein product [Chilo suppressalis]
MSRSSSGSWSEAAPLGDIIDLDRFMRTAKPSQNRDAHRGLVVDAGERSRKLASSSSTTEERTRTQRDKRFSHDSGLSDGSYAPRRHRQHRRVSAENAGKQRNDVQPKGSAGSLRAFRTNCERTLREQQQQIARVAQLCERLTDRRQTTDSSDMSSTSQSTRDPRRKDKHRTDECKTYKIIMNKLDELNRLFAARARSPPPQQRRLRRPDPETPPSDSVSVSDKLVATEPMPSCSPRNTHTSTVACDRARRLSALRAVAAGPALDIAPAGKSRAECPNVHTESVVKRESSDASSSSCCDPHHGFDLDNPVHLYAQAKRLQALHATTTHRRTRSVESPRGSTLCALCRGYFRSLRQYLTAQLLCCPAESCVY